MTAAASKRNRPAESAFAVYNVRVFLAGQGLSNIGTFFQIVALSLLVLHITGSGFALGLTLGLGAVPFLVLGPWAGTVIDRVQIRRLLIVTSTVACLQALTLGIVISAGRSTSGGCSRSPSCSASSRSSTGRRARRS
jgi:hypothetical protein